RFEPRVLVNPECVDRAGCDARQRVSRRHAKPSRLTHRRENSSGGGGAHRTLGRSFAVPEGYSRSRREPLCSNIDSRLGAAVMRNLFLASLTLAVLIAGPATAADLPYTAPPPLQVAYYDWSGAYVGLNVGGTHYNVTHHFPSPGAIT